MTDDARVPGKTRAEHMAWCKQRAKDEFQYYLKHDGLADACRNGTVSMMSDLGKHPETQHLVQTAFLVAMTVKDVNTFRSFVEGFH